MVYGHCVTVCRWTLCDRAALRCTDCRAEYMVEYCRVRGAGVREGVRSAIRSVVHQVCVKLIMSHVGERG